MSSASNTASTSSYFETLFNAALEKYTKQTGKDLRNHPFADRIDICDSPDSILEIFEEQTQAFDEFRRGDTKLSKWVGTVVNVLHALSTNEVVSEGASLVSPATFLIHHSFRVLELSIPQVFPPAKAIFSGIGILLSVRISLVISAPLHVTSGTARRLRMGGQATTP
jgi:hypothetical protein